MKAAQLSKVCFRVLAFHRGEHAHQGCCTACPSRARLCLHKFQEAVRMFLQQNVPKPPAPTRSLPLGVLLSHLSH